MQDVNQMNIDAPEGAQDQQDAPGTPIDDIISTVDQFMADPKSVTPETLGQLKLDLEDLKTILDGDQQQPAGPPPPPAGGLAGMIGGK